jgi:hypothetical protein
MVIAIDDNDPMNLLPLFNTPTGRDYLVKAGVPESLVGQLDLLGISSIANLLSAIKFAKYYELTSKDIILTVFTDSMEMYNSRLKEYEEANGAYTLSRAERDFYQHLIGLRTDTMQELNYYDRRRIHNLKYFTWIEQQGKTVEEINAQWYDAEKYWGRVHGLADKIDELIIQFNELVEKSH